MSGFFRFLPHPRPNESGHAEKSSAQRLIKVYVFNCGTFFQKMVMPELRMGPFVIMEPPIGHITVSCDICERQLTSH